MKAYRSPSQEVLPEVLPEVLDVDADEDSYTYTVL